MGSCSLLPALSLSPYDAPTPLPGEADIERRMRVTERPVARGKQQTTRKVQGMLRVPLPHSPPSQIVARPRATIPDNTQQPRRHDNTLTLSLGLRSGAPPLLPLTSFDHVRGTLRRDHVVK